MGKAGIQWVGYPPLFSIETKKRLMVTWLVILLTTLHLRLERTFSLRL